jgi:hypothetical protein
MEDVDGSLRTSSLLSAPGVGEEKFAASDSGDVGDEAEIDPLARTGVPGPGRRPRDALPPNELVRLTPEPVASWLLPPDSTGVA